MQNKYYFSYNTNSFDDFNYLVKSWEVDFRPIDTGEKERIKLLQGYSGITHLSFVGMSSSVKQEANTPANCRTMAFLAPNHPPHFWCGKVIQDNQFLLFNSSGEMSSHSHPNFKAITISIPEHWYQYFCRRNRNLLDSRERILDAPAIVLEYVFSYTLMFLGEATQNTNIEESATKQDELIFNLLEGLFASISESTESRRSSQRNKLLNQALDYIHKDKSYFSVAELCKRCYCSQRTLERVFREFLGVSPKQYLKNYLLNEARYLLVHQSEDRTISEAARKFGFTYPSLFSKDYKQLFGKSPSDEEKLILPTDRVYLCPLKRKWGS